MQRFLCCVRVCVCACTRAHTCMHSFSPVQLFDTPWTAAHQAPLSMGFSRQEYWMGCHFLLQGDLPEPGIEPGSPALASIYILYH